MRGRFFYCLLIFGAVVLSFSARAQMPPLGDAEPYLFRLDDYGRIHVNARIDGFGPVDMLLDTGAARTTVNRSIVYTLGLEPVPWRTVQVRTATGIKVAEQYKIGGVEALGVYLPLGRVPALSNPNAGESWGILGVDLLRGRTLYVGQSGQGLYLLTDTSDFEDLGWSVFHGRPVGRGSLAVDVTIGDLRLPAVIDSGASHTVINVAGHRRLNEADNFRPWEGPALVQSSGGGQLAMRVKSPETKYINDTNWSLDTLLVADLPIFKTLGAKEVPAMIIGIDLLAEKDFAIDFRGWRLFLRDRPAEMKSPNLD